jgi:transcriptional regulator with XRE-family HTH domain
MAAAKRTGTRSPLPPMVAEMHANLAANLRKFRQAAGLSQRALADLADVSRDYIISIETDKPGRQANVSIDILARIAVHLGKTPIDLLKPPKRWP